jgi:AraC-like DNA-binding protein
VEYSVAKESDPVKNDLIRELLTTKLSYREISERTGMSSSYIAKLYKEISTGPRKHQQETRVSDLTTKIKLDIEQGKNFAQIAREIGYSRERIRQIALRIGVIGRENQVSIKSSRNIKAVSEQKLLSAFAAELDKRAIKWSPILKNQRRDSLKSKINVENKVVIVKTSHNYSRYIVIQRTEKSTSFDYAAILINNSDWMILPADKVPYRGTSISLSPTPNFGAKQHRHDWREYLNNFDPFKNEKET